ncbi:MAG: hypothetical protein CMB95_01880 [Flavobacteriaceae bacterium]|nr:hypothetical protein [Flavobacteriaceae bacterium]
MATIGLAAWLILAEATSGLGTALQSRRVGRARLAILLFPLMFSTTIGFHFAFRFIARGCARGAAMVFDNLDHRE